VFKLARNVWIVLISISIGFVSHPVLAGPAAPKAAPASSPNAISKAKQACAHKRKAAKTSRVIRGPGESADNLKAILVESGYNAVADDGAHTDFDQVELDSLREASREEVRIGGKNYLVVYFEASADGSWGADSIIAVFDRKPKLHLVDAANVQGDRETYIHPRLKVSPNDDLIVVSCCHLNAGEDYCFISLYSLVTGKLTRVDNALPLLYSPRNNGLDLKRNYKMSTIKDPSGKRGKILFNIREEEIRYDEESDKVKSKRVHFYPLVYYPRGSFYELRKKDPVAAKFRAHAKVLGVDDPF
jgi:hypothetical protein